MDVRLPDGTVVRNVPDDITQEELLARVASFNSQQGAATQAPTQGYKPFATVRKDIDPATLNTDPDWLRASRMMYEMWERKPFQGTDEQLAEWGKDSMGYFNFNLVSMAQIAKAVTDSTQENKEAFLYMMGTSTDNHRKRSISHAQTDTLASLNPRRLWQRHPMGHVIKEVSWISVIMRVAESPKNPRLSC